MGNWLGTQPIRLLEGKIILPKCERGITSAWHNHVLYLPVTAAGNRRLIDEYECKPCNHLEERGCRT